MALELKFFRPDRVYRPPDVIDGSLLISAPSGISHQGIRITVSGTVMLQPGVRSVGVLESLYTSVKPIQLLCKSVDISSPGKVYPGNREVPFHIALDGSKGGSFGSLYETYHGAHVNIQYILTAEVLRGYIQKSLSTTLEFIVESGKGAVPCSPTIQAESVYFYITQDTQKHSLLPSIHSGGFRVTGKVTTQCRLTEPVIGEITVESSVVPIQSIDVSLLRTESIALNERMSSETTEIQMTQVADGDVCRGLSLPIYLILPRLLTCPTLSTGTFSLEFGLSIVVTFEADISKFHPHSDSMVPKEWVAVETLPLRLMR